MERQARAHGVALLLPDDYLEEAAVHLIDAWRDYKPLLDTVEALQGSTNAYVSHYSYLHTAGKISDFNTYLRTLGVREHILSSGTFPEQRRIVMRNSFAALFRGTTLPSSPSAEHRAMHSPSRRVRCARSPQDSVAPEERS